MAKAKRDLIVGIGGHVVAVDPATGEELWRTKLKGGSFVTLRQGPDRVYAGAGGELFGLDRATGEILWNNRLKGLGVGVLAFEGDDATVASAAAAAAASRAATTPGTMGV